MTADDVRKILEELVTEVLPHWQVSLVTVVVAQGDRPVWRVNVTFEIEQ